MRILFCFSLCLSILSFITSEAVAARKVALVIGNGSYRSAPLKNPVNDAESITKTLQNLGFTVIKKTNADKPEMESAIENFHNRLRSSSVGLFFYAGHGMQINGRNYLIPTGIQISSEADVKYKAVEAGWVLGKMKDAGNHLNIIILDACRDNPFARSFRTTRKGLARMDAPKGAIIAYSTSPGEVAMDGKGANSPYTRAILENINTPGLPIELFFKNVRKNVDSLTSGQQTPWEATSLLGDFYFTRVSVPPQPEAKPVMPPAKKIKHTPANSQAKKVMALIERRAARETADKNRFLSRNIHFETGKTDLSSMAKIILKEKSEFLKQNISITATIKGYCDEREQNTRLSIERARTVKQYLTLLGINASRLRAVGSESKKKRFKERNESILRADRRVEFIID